MHVEENDLAPRHRFARDVVALAAEGLSVEAIAGRLGITSTQALELGREEWQRARLAAHRERIGPEHALAQLFGATETAP